MVSEARYFLTNHKSMFASDLTTNIKETVEIGAADLGSIQALVERALAKQEKTTLEASLYTALWNSDELKPSMIEIELYNLFKFSQDETTRRQNGGDYFLIDESYLNQVTGEEARSNHQAQKWSQHLHDHVRKKDLKVFSGDEIKSVLATSSIVVEWLSANTASVYSKIKNFN